MSPVENPHSRGERVAIVGSRTYPELGHVISYVRDLPPGTTIVSGGARGVDKAAADTARFSSKGLSVVEHLPDYQRYGKVAPLERNRLIVADCDRLVAFWDGKSTGTMHAVGLARKAGKPVEIIQP